MPRTFRRGPLLFSDFFCIFELVQASGRMVGAHTIPRPPQSYSHKNLRQCSMKYSVQNEVAAQMNSWRARRHMLQESKDVAKKAR